MVNTTGLSQCASHYALAISEPFHPDAAGACIPKLPARMSEKVHGTLRFSVTAGTAGYAFIAFSPCLANNGACVTFSTSAFTGTSTVGCTSATTGVATLEMATLPYSSTDMRDLTEGGNPAVVGRIVSAGLSVQYIGQSQLRGGVTRSYTDPNHGNLFGQQFAQNSATGVAVQTVSDRKRKYVLSAIDTDEWEYSTGEIVPQEMLYYPYSQGKALNNTDTHIGGAPFFWDMTTTPGNSVFCEIIVHCEYIGRISGPRLTPSHADSAGFEKVAAASAKVNSLRAARPEADMASLFRGAFAEVMRELKPVAMSGVRSAVGSLKSYL